MAGFMYILKCVNDRLYVGSTRDLEKRLIEHEAGEGAYFTKDYLPVELDYYEEFDRIDDAFSREKQIQKWSRKKKEALIKGDFKELKRLAECRNETHFRNKKK